MRGVELNQRRAQALESLAQRLEKAATALRVARDEYLYFDDFAEYRNEYAAEYLRGVARLEARLLIKVIAVLEKEEG